MTEIGTFLQNRYLIEKKIGAGGMGTVYLAVDKRFDNYVAIKETFYNDEEFGAAFEREARLLNALQHPVLPHVTDYFAENNGYFLVMQYIEGEDLSDILKHGDVFPVEVVMRWTFSLLDALEYLHLQEPPIVHRDIKPHNLKLMPRGDIMLLDFGLAKASHDDTTGISVFGYSRTYSPLEQIQGTGTNARSDIYALGATVYHLLTGKPPVDALTRAAVIVSGKPDPIQLAGELNPEIPSDIASILNSALTLNAENRFISAKAMRQALESAVSADLKREIVENEFKPPVGAARAGIIETDKNSPALAAFVAESEQKSDAGQPVRAKVTDGLPNRAVGELHPPTDSFFNSNMPAETPTKISTRTKTTRTPRLWTVLAILLFCVGVGAALYLSGSDNSVNQTDQPPVAETTPSVKSNRKTSETTSSNPESVAETKTKPAEKPAVSRSAQESGTVEDQETSNDPEIDRSDSSRRQKQISKDDEPDARTDDSETEIVESERENERPNNKTDRRRSEQPIPDEMSEEEFQRLQRELKQKRRERRNKPDQF